MLIRSDGSEIYVLWSLEYEDGTEVAAVSSAWNELAASWWTHGIPLLFTKKKIACLTLFPDKRGDGRHYNIRPPSPRPFFSFARMAQPLQGDPEWRYSAFGYELDDGSLFVLKVYPWHDMDMLVLDPNEIFPL